MTALNAKSNNFFPPIHAVLLYYTVKPA